MIKYILVIIMILLPLNSYAGTSTGMMMGAAIGSSVAASSNARANSVSLSSAACPDRNFAVIKCDAYDKSTAFGRLFDKCDNGGGRSFTETAQAYGLKNATVGNVLFDSYYGNFLITICYDE